jgi:tight adherence protein B
MRPAELASLLESGVDLKNALAQADGFDLTPIRFAIDTGAELVPLLWQLEQQQRNTEQASSQLSQALAVPTATRRLLVWLPALSLVMAQFLGLTSLAAYSNPLVIASLLLGAVLLFVGSKISGRQLARAKTEFDVDALQDFLVCISAGLNLGQIAQHRPDVLSDERVSQLQQLSMQTGAALVPLTRGAIERSLATQLSDQIEKLQQLSVRILIPLGLTTLPAFLLFTIPPILVGSLR